MDRSLFKAAIPAAIVASVLGLSMLYPALAGDHAGGAGNAICGYGYGNAQDTDETGDNGNRGTNASGSVKAARPDDSRDHDCNEDEDENDGGGNVGGGGNAGGGGGDKASRSSQPTDGASSRLGRNRE